MLILTRKIDESIMIGDDVRITVIDVKAHQVRISIDAPKDIDVHRLEIHHKIQSARRESERVTK